MSGMYLCLNTRLYSVLKTIFHLHEKKNYFLYLVLLFSSAEHFTLDPASRAERRPQADARQGTRQTPPAGSAPYSSSNFQVFWEIFQMSLLVCISKFFGRIFTITYWYTLPSFLGDF